MATPVWTFNVNYVIKRTRRVDRVRVDLGVGYMKTVIKTLAGTTARADGTGSVTIYKGQNIFALNVNRKSYDGSADFITILDFLQLRVDNNDEAFFFYHPDELFPPDATGVNTTGRYKVQCLQDIGDVLTHLKVHNFTTLIFEETFF